MQRDILMPALAAGMEEGKLARWLKGVGDRIVAGEIIAEIESDKAVMEVQAEADGVLQEVLVAEGDTVPINTTIAVFRSESGLSPSDGTAAVCRAQNAAAEPETVAPAGGTSEATFASAPSASAGVVRAIPTSSLRRVIAHRLAEAKSQVPHFYLNLEVEVDALLEIRSRLNREAGDTPLSVTDFIVKASAVALRQVPEINASWTEEAVVFYDAVDIALAVAIDGGLITPVIRGADRMSVHQIAACSRALIQRARDGKLQPAEYQGGGFTISNLGMHGVDAFAAIINPPQSSILAVGAAKRRPVVRGDACVAATVIQLTLSADHRSVDGIVGARFLGALKRVLEAPQASML